MELDRVTVLPVLKYMYMTFLTLIVKHKIVKIGS